MPNRYVCDVLDEMRNTIETLNFSPLLGLVEECQTLVNRMESSLCDRSDIRNFKEELHDLKHEKRNLEIEVKEMKWELEDLVHGIKVEKCRRRSEERSKKKTEAGLQA